VVTSQRTWGDPWVGPIWRAVNKAVESGKVQSLPPEVYRLGLHLSTRLNILPRVIQRVNSNTSLLYEKTKQYGPEYVYSETRQGHACPIDNDLKYSLLADIDGLLFELNSTCELMTRLFGILHARVGQPIPQKQLGKAVGECRGPWYIPYTGHKDQGEFPSNGAKVIPQ
jgi:hypothetical protein